MSIWRGVAAVAIGGAAGAVARFVTARAVASLSGGSFPHGTLTVNVVGSFILGFLTGLVANNTDLSPDIQLLVGVGFCGSLTTFSTFAVETLDQSLGLGLVNIGLNNALSITAAMLGLYLAMRLG